MLSLIVLIRLQRMWCELVISKLIRKSGGFRASSNKVSSEQLAMLQVQEEKLKIREEKLVIMNSPLSFSLIRYLEDMARLRTEQLNVHELNLRLNDSLKKSEEFQEQVTRKIDFGKDYGFQEKWKVKEEWNKLKAERQIFKENQKHVLENLQREKQNIAKTMVRKLNSFVAPNSC